MIRKKRVRQMRFRSTLFLCLCKDRFFMWGWTGKKYLEGQSRRASPHLFIEYSGVKYKAGTRQSCNSWICRDSFSVGFIIDYETFLFQMLTTKTSRDRSQNGTTDDKHRTDDLRRPHGFVQEHYGEQNDRQRFQIPADCYRLHGQSADGGEVKIIANW